MQGVIMGRQKALEADRFSKSRTINKAISSQRGFDARANKKKRTRLDGSPLDSS